MHALRISAGGWLQTIEIDASSSRSSHPATLAAPHNLELWYAAESSADAEPNMAAMSLALSVCDLTPHDVPLICGEVVIVGIDPDTNIPTGMTRQQYQAISYALLSSLAA